MLSVDHLILVLLVISLSRINGLVPPPQLLLLLLHHGDLITSPRQQIMSKLLVDSLYICSSIALHCHFFLWFNLRYLTTCESMYMKVHKSWVLQKYHYWRFWAWETTLETYLLWSLKKVCLISHIQIFKTWILITAADYLSLYVLGKKFSKQYALIEISTTLWICLQFSLWYCWWY